MTEQPTQPQQNTTRTTRTILPFLTFLLVLVACAMSGYALLITKNNTHALVQLSSIAEKTTSPSFNAAELTTTLATLSEAHASLETQLSALSRLVNTQQPLSKNNSWVGQQAKYYLELAVVESTLGNNLSGCITLLKQAENLLLSLSDESLRPVLVAIQQATQTLQSFPSSETASILLQIHQLQHLLDKAFPAPSNTATPSSTKTLPSIKQIQSLISVKHHHANTQAEVIFQRTLLSNRIELNLQIAQAALLQHNEALYQQSIMQAIKAAQDLPSVAASVQQSMIEALTALQKTTIFTQPPSLDAPLNALNEWLSQQQSER